MNLNKVQCLVGAKFHFIGRFSFCRQHKSSAVAFFKKNIKEMLRRFLEKHQESRHSPNPIYRRGSHRNRCPGTYSGRENLGFDCGHSWYSMSSDISFISSFIHSMILLFSKLSSMRELSFGGKQLLSCSHSWR